MYSLVLILSLNGFVISGIFSRYFGREISLFLSLLNIFCLFLVSVFIFYEIGLLETVVNLKLFNWFLIDSVSSTFGLLFDSLTALMLIIVCSISFFVHLYSLGYMKHDPFILRFMSYLSLFTFFMLVLITSDNFVQMFFGWEGVGLCSYLLISF
jgi:NADH-quinone oxidoreductase subunit L